ncbi:MAG: exo-alpha-sialidase [Verrucomicrobia bacterium]|nr:exo-alpha-sialidase [Verrucomicrobiota bacterium]
MNATSISALSRRTFLRHAAWASGAAWLGVGSRVVAAPAARVLDTRVISPQPEHYHGWPTLARRRNGDLLVVCSGGREGHVCPFGRVEMMVSRDEGRMWGWPQVLWDSAMDDRDAGVVETARGSLLVTTFTSLAYAPALEAAEKRAAGTPGSWPADRLARWQSAHRRLSAAQRPSELGQWMLRSTDGGVSWSGRYSSLVNSPHGPIQLADGRLLYAGKELWTGRRRVGVCESRDDGQTWQWLADIPARPGDAIAQYHELHAVETADGRVLVHIRNHNSAHNNETLQAESADGGRRWSEPRSIGVWGLPSHLLRLRNDHLLMTYGHRRAPLGNQARLSTDHGRTWSDPLVVSSDGTSGDLGYPSTVELADGTLLTVWYELMKGSPRAVLRQCRWTLAP